LAHQAAVTGAKNNVLFIEKDHAPIAWIGSLLTDQSKDLITFIIRSIKIVNHPRRLGDRRLQIGGGTLLRSTIQILDFQGKLDRTQRKSTGDDQRRNCEA